MNRTINFSKNNKSDIFNSKIYKTLFEKINLCTTRYILKLQDILEH